MIHNKNWPGNPSSIDIIGNISIARRSSFEPIAHVNTKLGYVPDWLGWLYPSYTILGNLSEYFW